METISFDVTKQEHELIGKIARKAARELDMDILTVIMDLTACHANGNPLRLQELLNADDFNFAHDVVGINNHINRTTGKLEDFFSPRFSAPVNEAA